MFEVFLMPTTASPPRVQVVAQVRKTIFAEGGTIQADGAGARTGDGVSFTLGDDGRFGVDRLSLGLCRVIFDAAVRTNSTVERLGADAIPLRMHGVKGATRFIEMRTDPISDPAGLCARLDRDLVAWNRFVSEQQTEGVMGPHQEALEPPASPGTETRLSSDPSGVAAACVAEAAPFDEKMRSTIVRTVVSRNPQYGVVWRADMVNRKHPKFPSRLVCWRPPGAGGAIKVMFEVRPLEMFDPSQSVGPLDAEPPSVATQK